MSHYSPIAAALITMLLTIVILISKFGKEIQDIPNERSLHETPIPRVGGVAMMAGLLTGWALMLTSLVWWVVVPLVGLFMVSLWDDIHNLPVKKRLMIHLLAAATLVLGSGAISQFGMMIAMVLFFFTIWMTNLYNFMDGSDGLAGGMALFGFTFYGVAALFAHDDMFAMMNFTIGAAALGFLYNNFHPAKIFMGDAGSIPLGFLAAAMGLQGWILGYWQAWFPLMVFSPFIVDSTVTLVRRALRGIKITEAHREHYYQKAIQMGAGHRNVALVEYILMFGVGVSSLWTVEKSLPWSLLIVWFAIYVGFMWFIEISWKKFQSVNV